jgi:hypothetical protein
VKRRHAKRIVCEAVAGYLQDAKVQLYGWMVQRPDGTDRPADEIAALDAAAEELWREMCRRGTSEPITPTHPEDT